MFAIIGDGIGICRVENQRPVMAKLFLKTGMMGWTAPADGVTMCQMCS